MAFAQTNGARIHYELAGPANAPVVMFSNSLGTALGMWEPQAREFTAQFRVLRYDTRGHGQSSVTPGPYSIAQLGRDVIGLLDELNLSRVAFCGLSMGGGTGIWLGIEHPKRLEKLVLCSTAMKIGSPEFWNARIGALRNGGMKAISQGVVARWFTPEFHKSHPEVVAEAVRVLDATDPAGYAANCAAVRDFDERERAGQVTVPTLVACGTHDLATPVVGHRELVEKIRGAEYAEFPASHLLNIEAGDAFNARLTKFLAR
jgi:3-oxoadipate enol-lactonase